MNEYDDFQNSLKAREFCIGWRLEGSQEKIYYEALFDSWHEANTIACGSAQPGYIPFVETATETKICPRCNGVGKIVLGDYDADICTHCHGKGRVRA
jgi:hypothetical protein